MMEKVVDFFIKNTKYNKQQIILLEKIDNSFTNAIFHIQLVNNLHFKIRFASKNEYINRELEKNIEYQLYKDDIVYYDNEGNFIKKWYVGHTLNKEDLNDNFFFQTIDFIKKFQTISTEHIDVLKPTYVLYDHLVEQKLIRHLLAYKKIINEDVKTNNNVLCHNDLSSNNIVIGENKIIYMDFEWATFNHPYWDFANLIKDLELNIDELLKFNFIKNYDFNLLLKIIYATHFYTYYWTYKMEETEKIKEYRNSVIKQIIYWYNILKERKIIHA